MSAKVAERHGTLLVELVAQALAVLHVDGVSGLGQPIEQGGRQVLVVQKRSPIGEAQVRSDERRLLLVPLSVRMV